jgi:glycosyltransferase involved in cell wall biosynthesis
MLHGVDLETVRHGEAARAEGRARLGFGGDEFVFGTVGNLAPKKDQGSLLEAFARVHRSLPQSRLVVIGTGPRERELKAAAEELGVAPAVRFLGMRDDVPDLLPGFDTFVLSSLHEGLSIALVEALAAGVPVVATRVGGIPELIIHGEYGLLVPPHDPDALAAAMEGLARNDRARQRLAAAGPVRAADFGIQPAADRLTAHYLVHAHRSTAPLGEAS